ncbi:MAG TPA: flagellar hook protein FlgE [Blastocatellia bacterium]|nr:flagellar hook protein FlgE [Blastocatellia bacterium]
MSSIFFTSLSGLEASQDALDVTGNNIANSNTTAYKAQQINFADMFLDTLTSNGAGMPLQLGNGVMTSSIEGNLSQGAINPSASPTDMAISGNGYFVVDDQAGAQSYTRAGNFTLNKDGFLVTPGGQELQGYAAVNGVVPPNAALTALQIPIGSTIPPTTTANVTMQTNLDATAAVGTSFTASVQVYDSLGASHTLNVVYTETANQQYSVAANLDGNAATVSPAAVAFDQNGKLTTPAPPASLVVTPDQTKLNGASLPTINVNLYGPDGKTPVITNYAAASNVASTSQDGSAAGTISSISVDNTGTISATFTNGKTAGLGQVALATFNSPQGLQQLTGSLYGVTNTSGPPSIGAPNSGPRGSISGGALEQSNVDISTEFTNLIVEQRSFQANSRVITTVNQAFQDLLQII